MRECQSGNRTHDYSRDRKNAKSRDQPLNSSNNHLLDSDQWNRYRRKQSVLDFICPSKILHHRQRNALDGRKCETHAKYSWKQNRFVRCAHEAHLRQETSEHDDEHERLHQRANEKEWKLAPRHARVPREERKENSHRRNPVRRVLGQSSLWPASDMKNVSRDPS